MISATRSQKILPKDLKDFFLQDIHSDFESAKQNVICMEKNIVDAIFFTKVSLANSL
jgi:hypothetical protein